MSDAILVALLSFAGSALAAFGGMRIAVYRIEQLEKKVDKHNSIIERVFKLEGQVSEVIHDVEDLKKFQQRGV